MFTSPLRRPSRRLFPAIVGTLTLSALAGALMSAPSVSAAAVKPGTACARSGSTASAGGGISVRCTRSNGRLRWVTVTLPAVAPASPAPATAPPATAALAPTTRPGVAASVAATANVTTGCVSAYDANVDYFPNKAKLVEASAFSIRYEKNFKVLTVPEPWKGAKAPARVVLVQCGTPTPALTGDLANASVVQVPIKSAVIMSTTLAPMFDLLGRADAIVAVDDPVNYSTISVVNRLAAGSAIGVGNNARANVEKLISLSPSAVFTYGSSDSSFDGIDKLRQAGQKIVLEASFLEQTPLGRAEWIKAIAATLNEEAKAESLFASWRSDYIGLAARVARTSARPVVIANSMFQGTWFMPGGNSFPAQLIRDAGGFYPWSSDKSTGSLALDFESVADKAYDATFWINAGYLWNDLRDVRAADTRYASLAAFTSGNVWGNDKRVNATGGSDFFETAVVRPDLVLADLVSILHPGILPAHQTLWYRRIPR